MSDRAVPQLPLLTELLDTDEVIVWRAPDLYRTTVKTLGAATGGGTTTEPAPEPTPTGHTHWRVLRLTSRDAYYYGKATLDFHHPTTGATFFASTKNTADTGPEKAFDGDPATIWQTSFGSLSGAHIGAVFPEPVDVVQITMTAGSAGSQNEQMPTGFAVEHSDDGTTWVEVWRVEGLLKWNLGETRTFHKPA